MTISVAPVSSRRRNSTSSMIAAGGGVEIAGRLVGEDQRRARGDGAGDGHALLLAARKLRRIMGEAMAEADRFQFRRRALPGIASVPASSSGVATFSCAVMVGSRWNACSTMPMRPAPRASASASSVERGEIGPRHLQLAGRCPFQPGQHRHQRALAAARRAEQRERLAGRDIEIDTAQDFHRSIAFAKRQAQVAGGNDGRCIRGTCHRAAMA